MDIKHYKSINNILGWAIGIIACAVYILTAEPTVSWWDCGEYIATTDKLLIGHPPGAPTFQIIGHFFTMLAGGDVTQVAHWMNTMSALCSGLTILFLFWTMTMLGRKLVNRLGEMTTARAIALFGSATVAALTYTFTDTFWFSAVEGEVYAMSSFFTALVVWCVLKWDMEYEKPISGVNPFRWIILIAYLIGLSIGVHLLNLLTLPAIVLVMYFRLSKKATHMGVVLALTVISFFGAILLTTTMMLLVWIFITAPLFILCIKKGTIKSLAEWGVLLSVGISFILIGFLLFGLIPGIVNLAGKFEIFFINIIGLPFNSGTIIYFLLIFGSIAFGLYWGHKYKKRILNASILSLLFIIIGYSTFITLVIRSNANPTIDENDPEDAVSLLSYLNREQYGSTPFIYGQSYNSRLIGYKNGTPVYVRDDKAKKYVVSDNRKNTEPQYHPDDMTLFPRMYAADKGIAYVDWLKEQYDPVKDKDELRLLGRNKIPTHDLNAKFMQTYQFNYMYFRYFMWNFAGKQNIFQGRGGFQNGNWISGIPFIDNKVVGRQDHLPTPMQNSAHNKYYLLPLILGLIGLVYYSRKDAKGSFIVLLLFVMTGLAIAFYLNMYAFQPRERDYAFAASFYAFSMWIGFGDFDIYAFLEKIKNHKIQIAGATLASLLCLGLVPGIMASENWDDHDRSHRYTTLATAKAYLDSCAPNAILFTLGDNDTFPLWYAQVVEGYRTDVRVCNLSLLSASWYVDQMKRKAYNSDPLPISMTWEQYRDGTRDVAFFAPANNQFLDLKTVVDYIKSPVFDHQKQLVLNGRGGSKAIPCSFSMPVDKEQVLKTGTVKPYEDSLIVDRMTWNVTALNSNVLHRAYLTMMDILAHNNWERPIYFATTTGPEAYLGLEEYFQLEGLAYRLVPIRTPKGQNYEFGRINHEILYERLMNFDQHNRIDKINHPDAPQPEVYPYAFGGMNDPVSYRNEDDYRMTRSLRRLYTRLGQSLSAAGDQQKAEEVYDHSLQVIPDNIYPYYFTLDLGYTYSNIQQIQAYMALRTPSGEEKAVAMASRMIDYFIENYIWYNDCDEKTLSIHRENFSMELSILEQVLNIIGKENELKLADKLKQIPFKKTIEYAMDETNKNIMGLMSNPVDNIQAIYQSLQFIHSLCGMAAEVSGDEVLAKKAEEIVNAQLANMEKMDPRYAESLRQNLSRR
jgi:MFS family permease